MEKIKLALEVAEKNRLALAEGSRLSADPGGTLRSTESESTPAPEALRPDDGRSAPNRTDDGAPQEMRKFVRTRVVPASPEQLERHRIVLPDAGSDASRAYDMLASRMLEKLRGSGWNSIAIVSPGDNEGKTITAINLAIHLAASRERTALLVDMDFRRPSVARYLGLQTGCGIDDVIGSHADLASALVSPGIDRFTVLPVRRAHASTSDFIDSRRARELAAELKQRYANRIVLFDLPPLLAYGDALRFLPNVDAALMVVAEGRTKRESADRALSALEGQNMAGVVMNRSSETVTGY